MKKIIYISIVVILSLSSCKKQEIKKFEGTYTNTEYDCNPSVTVKLCGENKICFNYKFGCYTIQNLTCDYSSTDKFTIQPVSEIGVMSQGGCELFGGTVTREDNKLTIVLDHIQYCDPNDPPFINCVAERKTETFIYTKN